MPLKIGYKELFRDPYATTVIPSITGLKNVECTNICYMKPFKTMTKTSSSTPSSIVNPIAQFFGNLFGNKK
jgi:hypothetical protein